MIAPSAISPHPLLKNTPRSKARFPDVVSGIFNNLMVSMMRPPVVVPAGDGTYYAVANLRTVEWQRHLQQTRGASDPLMYALLVSSVPDPKVVTWATVERSLMPLLLGELSSRGQRKALEAIKAAGIPGLTAHPLARRQRLKSLTER
jgi:hypothetical protein